MWQNQRAGAIPRASSAVPAAHGLTEGSGSAWHGRVAIQMVRENHLIFVSEFIGLTSRESPILVEARRQNHVRGLEIG